MTIHFHQQVAARARHQFFQHVKRSFGFRLKNLESEHTALTVHLDLVFVRQRFQLGTGQFLAQNTAIYVIAALNRRFAAAHGLHHRACKHNAVVRRRALRISAENQLRRDADHQKGFTLKGHRHARLHELRQIDLAAVFLRQKDGALRIQQPERLH